MPDLDPFGHQPLPPTRSARPAPVQPSFELGERYEDPPAATDDAQLADHVLVEVVAAHAENRRGLVWAYGQAWAEGFARGRAIPLRARLIRRLDPNHLEL